MSSNLYRHYPIREFNDLSQLHTHFRRKVWHSHQWSVTTCMSQVVQNLQRRVHIPEKEWRWRTGFWSRSNSKNASSDHNQMTWNLNVKKCIKTHKTTSLQILDSKHVRSLSETCCKLSSENSIHTFYSRAHLRCWGQALTLFSCCASTVAWLSLQASLIGTGHPQSLHKLMLWVL